jgi:hypothetical protein
VLVFPGHHDVGLPVSVHVAQSRCASVAHISISLPDDVSGAAIQDVQFSSVGEGEKIGCIEYNLRKTIAIEVTDDGLGFTALAGQRVPLDDGCEAALRGRGTSISQAGIVRVHRKFGTAEVIGYARSSVAIFRLKAGISMAIQTVSGLSKFII